MVKEKKFVKSATILAIESLWFKNIVMPKMTIQPLLEMISHETQIPYAYFSANTREEFRFVLNKFNNSNPGILYLASHGRKGRFWMGDGNVDYLTLSELGYFLKGKMKNRAIHISSCETFNVDEEDIMRFKKTTGATIVSGYTKEVDWLESSAMDLLYLSSLQRGIKNIDRFVNDFYKKYECLIEINGLKVCI